MKNNAGLLNIIVSLFFILAGAKVEAREKLILLGGGGYTPEAIAKFVHWAGGQDAKILILPWATSEPDEPKRMRWAEGMRSHRRRAASNSISDWPA